MRGIVIHIDSFMSIIGILCVFSLCALCVYVVKKLIRTVTKQLILFPPPDRYRGYRDPFTLLSFHLSPLSHIIIHHLHIIILLKGFNQFDHVIFAGFVKFYFIGRNTLLFSADDGDVFFLQRF